MKVQGFYSISLALAALILQTGCAAEYGFQQYGRQDIVVPDDDNNNGDDGDGGQHCKEVDAIGIFKNEALSDSNQPKEVKCFEGNLTAEENYNYYSWSAHPVVGPALKAHHGVAFLYCGPDGMSFNVIFDHDNSPNAHNKVDIGILSKTKLKDESVLMDGVIHSDDRREMKQASVKIENSFQISQYEGNFQYWRNSDGGVMGPYTKDAFKIKVNKLGLGNVGELVFYSADGNEVVLGNSTGALKRSIQSYKKKVCDCKEEDKK